MDSGEHGGMRGRQPAEQPAAATEHAPEALIVVDVQNDFCSGGALAIAGGEEVIEPIGRLGREVEFVVATRDWHPPEHHSFDSQGGPWPVHCVQGTAGAELHPELERARIEAVVDAGHLAHLEGYSGFEETGLEAMLRERGVKRVHVAGLALDYCVKHTALDARRLGFDVVVHRDATRAVNVHPGDDERAVDELLAAGVEVTPSREA
jgi:nicotinamidase/pyrazinamidase